MTWNRVKAFLTNIALVSVSLLLSWEIFSNALYVYKRGAFFYAQVSTTENEVNQGIRLPGSVFHPYLGFLNRQGRVEETWVSNNHGWPIAKKLIDQEAPWNTYPYEPQPDELIIGIFGGSVAAGFALDAQDDREFAEALEQLKATDKRKVRILNFAMSGYKQPQQALTLAYYLSLGQKFDLVINIDGFNEAVTMWHNWSNNIDPMNPADQVWGAMARALTEQASVSKADKNFDAAYHQHKSAEANRAIDRCVMASCYGYHRLMVSVHARLAEWYRGKAGWAETADASAEFFASYESVAPAVKVQFIPYIADRWFDASLTMRNLATGSGAAYLHVLQPNQWFRPSGDYQPMNPDHIYDWVIDPVNLGYTEMLSRADDLASAGVNFWDASALLPANRSRSLWLDDCCHYTEAGYDIFFKGITEQIQRHGLLVQGANYR